MTTEKQAKTGQNAGSRNKIMYKKYVQWKGKEAKQRQRQQPRAYTCFQLKKGHYCGPCSQSAAYNGQGLKNANKH